MMCLVIVCAILQCFTQPFSPINTVGCGRQIHTLSNVSFCNLVPPAEQDAHVPLNVTFHGQKATLSHAGVGVGIKNENNSVVSGNSGI
jgi:hypothetical protein